jgi:hypothetical protein
MNSKKIFMERARNLTMSEETKKFIDDKIQHIESDIKKIQTKPGMYIAQIGSAGALHLCKELINNAIDECINRNSPADVIDIYLDEGENEITVSDNGICAVCEVATVRIVSPHTDKLYVVNHYICTACIVHTPGAAVNKGNTLNVYILAS